MKSRKVSCVTAVTLFTLLAIPFLLSAQERGGEDHHGKHRRYRLVDIGTFGGPANYLENDFTGGAGGISGVLSTRGTVAGAADTSAPDPNFGHGSGFFPLDPLIMHAFQWQKGVLADLGAVPGGNNSFATWISANGLIAGFSENGVIDPQFGVPQVDAVLWKEGEIINLGGYFSAAFAVNNHGHVVGQTLNTATLPAANSLAFLWQNGEMQDLGTLGGPDSFAFLVNERGQVAGMSSPNSTASSNCPFTLITHPFLWDNGKMLDLGNLGGTCGLAMALNNRGQVVGQSNLAGDANFHPFLSKRGGLTDLGTFGGNLGSAFWINDAGEVVGWATTSGDQMAHAFLWKNGVMTDLGTVNGQPCAFAQNINSKRQVVGVAFDCVTPGGHAWLWENGGPIVDLNTLVPLGSNLTLELAQNINDRGEIAGIGSPPGCRDPFVCGHAFVLIPCDEEHADAEGCEGEREGTAAETQRGSAPVAQSADATQGRLTPEMLAALRGRFARRNRGLGIRLRQ